MGLPGSSRPECRIQRILAPAPLRFTLGMVRRPSSHRSHPVEAQGITASLFDIGISAEGNSTSLTVSPDSLGRSRHIHSSQKVPAFRPNAPPLGRACFRKAGEMALEVETARRTSLHLLKGGSFARLERVVTVLVEAELTDGASQPDLIRRMPSWSGPCGGHGVTARHSKSSKRAAAFWVTQRKPPRPTRLCRQRFPASHWRTGHLETQSVG